MNKELSARKKMRLQGYDYSNEGYYFVTICVIDRQEKLGRIIGDGVLDVPHCELTAFGKLIDSRIKSMNDIYNDIKTDKYVIMPNHVHLIICISNENGSSRTPTPTNAKIPRFISTLKRYTNKDCGFSVWQRSFHDQIIRDEDEYLRIWQYIDENPINWKDDEYHV